MEGKIHTCKNCGKMADDKGHLCDPVELKEAYICDCCGSAAQDARHICKPKLQKINFVCVSCGRVAQLPNQLCNPRDIELMEKGAFSFAMRNGFAETKAAANYIAGHHDDDSVMKTIIQFLNIQT